MPAMQYHNDYVDCLGSNTCLLCNIKMAVWGK